jgi:hypothetical protein
MFQPCECLGRERRVGTTPANAFDTGIPAVPGRYSTAELLGFSAPGVAYQIPVAYKPAR